MATYSFCTLTITALLLVSMQNVTQFNVKDRTSGTLFFVAVLISATIYNMFRQNLSQEVIKSMQGECCGGTVDPTPTNQYVLLPPL